MSIGSIAHLLDDVRTAGAMAVAAQRHMDFSSRAHKSDGSVVTDTDKTIDAFLFERVSRLHPEANILTEEAERPFDPRKPCTFTVDPVDGTDVFSQGMPFWAVVIGLLDQALMPIAGIVHAPRLDLLLLADNGKRATLNGDTIPSHNLDEPLSGDSNVMLASKMHRRFDLTPFPGKIRNVGSAALHLCFPMLYPAVFGAIESQSVRIWDITAPHAILLSLGFALEYLGGGRIDYAALTDGSPVSDIVMAGTKQRIDALRKVFVRK
jgi:fructose-1,6-bisphosphatase/inositol monophosphatase family enzyme